jgi:GNAT superfamily N-acetyltransferase
MGGVSLRVLDPAADRGLLEALWEAALAPAWPLLSAGLDVVGAGLVAEQGGRPVGAVGFDTPGGIQLLVVEPAAQGRGVGSALLDAAVERLRDLGARHAALGSGGRGHIWPGVPTELRAATEFFARRGWRWQEVVFDLVADLRGYRTPAGVHERAGAVVELAAGAARADVVGFEAEHFPDWRPYFERPEARILAARDGAGQVLGALLLEGRESPSPFAPMLGPDTGAIACVGVAEHAQGRGEGTALVARASELLRDEGVRGCHIGWTTRPGFYGFLGYELWRSYRMCRRRLTPDR